MYLFRDAPPGFVGSNPVTPEQAMNNVINYVNSQIQKSTNGQISIL